MPTDQHNEVKDDQLSAPARFSFSATKADNVMIYSCGKLAKTLSGKEADKFLHKIDQCSEEQREQLLMAKVTGQFKFGNERQGRRKPA